MLTAILIGVGLLLLFEGWAPCWRRGLAADAETDERSAAGAVASHRRLPGGGGGCDPLGTVPLSSQDSADASEQSADHKKEAAGLFFLDADTLAQALRCTAIWARVSSACLCWESGRMARAAMALSASSRAR